MLGIVLAVLGHVRLIVKVGVGPRVDVVIIVCAAVKIAGTIIGEMIFSPVSIILFQGNVRAIHLIAGDRKILPIDPELHYVAVWRGQA